MPCTSGTFRRLVRNLKGGINSDWQDTRIFPINTECKSCHQQESKNYTTFCPHAFRAKQRAKVIACVTCTLWKMAWRGSSVIYSNYHTRNMTPSYTSLLGPNFRPFYKSEECSSFSYLLVFKSCYEGELQSPEPCITRKKWTLKGIFVKIQDLRLKLVFL